MMIPRTSKQRVTKKHGDYAETPFIRMHRKTWQFE